MGSGKDQINKDGCRKENACGDHQQPDIPVLFTVFSVFKIAIPEGGSTLLPVEKNLLQAFCAVNKAREHIHIANDMNKTVSEEYHADQEKQIHNIEKAGCAEIMPEKK